MPFGLRHAPNMLQSNINVALSAFRWPFALVDLDDVVVLYCILAEHINHIAHVQLLFREEETILNLQKCSFFTETLDYLGQNICARRFETTSHTWHAVKALKTSRNVLELKSLLD